MCLQSISFFPPDASQNPTGEQPGVRSKHVLWLQEHWAQCICMGVNKWIGSTQLRSCIVFVDCRIKWCHLQLKASALQTHPATGPTDHSPQDTGLRTHTVSTYQIKYQIIMSVQWGNHTFLPEHLQFSLCLRTLCCSGHLNRQIKVRNCGEICRNFTCYITLQLCLSFGTVLCAKFMNITLCVWTQYSIVDIFPM